MLNHLRSRNVFLLLLDVSGDHFTAHFNQAVPRHLLDYMHRLATFGRLLQLFQHGRKRLRGLAKPILNLDNHRTGSCGRTMKHCLNTSMFYPGACLCVLLITKINSLRLTIGKLRSMR